MTDTAMEQEPFVRFTTDGGGKPVTFHVDEEVWSIAEVVQLLRQWPEIQRQYSEALAALTEAEEWQREAGIWEDAARRAQQQVTRTQLQEHEKDRLYRLAAKEVDRLAFTVDWFQSIVVAIAAMGPQVPIEQIFEMTQKTAQGPSEEEYQAYLKARTTSNEGSQTGS